MKKIIVMLVSLLLVFTAFSQEKKLQVLPEIDIKTADGTPFNTSNIDNEGQPIIICFWYLACKPCINELNNMADVYPDWLDEDGVKVYTVSIDNSRSAADAMTFANASWEYTNLLDNNKELFRALNFTFCPSVIILNKDKEIVWRHESYAEGNEDMYIEIARKVAAGEPIDEH
jgi:cytochrome c biogenesis protein CcmG, thiol:disulfide interchange protein DsbE